MGKIVSAFGLALLLALQFQEAAADSYRCGRKLIRSGDSPADVLRVCGEPQRKDRAHETIRVNGTTQSLPVERWFYRQGRRSLQHMVLIYRGKVVAIEASGR